MRTTEAALRDGRRRRRRHSAEFKAMVIAKSLRPVGAYDDGVQTRLRFGARAEFPTLDVKNDDDSESVLNFTVTEDDEVVIHRVARRFVLRRGQLVGCIENRAFDGGGERLRSKTLAPNVERRTKGAELR